MSHSDDGTVEGDDLDIWNVCDIDGLTGNVVATSKSRHVLALQGGYVEVPDFSHAPTDKASLAFWMQVWSSTCYTPFTSWFVFAISFLTASRRTRC